MIPLLMKHALPMLLVICLKIINKITQVKISLKNKDDVGKKIRNNKRNNAIKNSFGFIFLS